MKFADLRLKYAKIRGDCEISMAVRNRQIGNCYFRIMAQVQATLLSCLMEETWVRVSCFYCFIFICAPKVSGIPISKGMRTKISRAATIRNR